MKNNSIGKKLKKLREEAKYTIQQVARYFDNNIEMVEQWEEEEQQLSAEQILILSFLYGISMDEIFIGIEPAELVSKEYQEEYRHEAWLNRIGG